MVPTFTPGKFRFGGTRTSLPCIVRLSIGLWRFDPKGGLSREDEKILISAHQHIRVAINQKVLEMLEPVARGIDRVETALRPIDPWRYGPESLFLDPSPTEVTFGCC